MTEFLIYQIKVTLKTIKPPIWRRLQVRSNTRLDELHLILQAAMGWWNAHLHQFVVGGTRYSPPGPDAWEFPEDIDERTIRLDQIVTGERFKFLYEYDFGDSWMHDILVEKILPVEPGHEYPVCLKGKRACPPEDVGGPWGYEEFLEAIRDPQHPEHELYVEWIGGEFDPESFDLEAVNQALQSTQLPGWEEGGPVVAKTPIGALVLYPDSPPYVKYFLFRPDQAEVVAAIDARRAAGERVDWEEEHRLTSRFAELNLAIDEEGFLADLYLDRDLVDEDEVDEIVAVVCEMLDQVDVGHDGGHLAVYWMAEFADYGFPTEE